MSIWQHFALAAGYSSGTYSGNTVFVLPAPSQMPALIPIVHMGKVQFRQHWLQRVKNARMAPSASVLLASPFFCSTSCVQGHAHMADSAWQRVNMLPRKSDQLVLTVAPRSGTCCSFHNHTDHAAIVGLTFQQ